MTKRGTGSNVFAKDTPGRKCSVCGKGGSVWAIAGRYAHTACYRAAQKRIMRERRKANHDV